MMLIMVLFEKSISNKDTGSSEHKSNVTIRSWTRKHKPTFCRAKNIFASFCSMFGLCGILNYAYHHILYFWSGIFISWVISAEIQFQKHQHYVVHKLVWQKYNPDQTQKPVPFNVESSLCFLTVLHADSTDVCACVQATVDNNRK